MKTTYKVLNILFYALLSLFFVQCDKGDGDRLDTNDILELLNQDTDFKLISDAVKKTEMEGRLKDAASSYTVFVPNNAAFEEFFQSLGDDFNSIADFDTPEEIEVLKKIVLYHITSPSIKFEDFQEGELKTLLQGSTLNIIKKDDDILIEDATEFEALLFKDAIEALNGNIYVIDKVLLPFTTTATIHGYLRNDDDLSIFEKAVVRTNISTLDDPDQKLTVFAPTNEAFEDFFDFMGSGYNSLEDFDSGEEIVALRQMVLYHMVNGIYNIKKIEGETSLNTIQQTDDIEILKTNTDLFLIDKSSVQTSIVRDDIIASNGLVHKVDKVLLPQYIIDFVDSQRLSIMGNVVASPDLTILEDAINITNMVEVYTPPASSPNTLLAPSDIAFQKLFDQLGDQYNTISDFDTETEKAILKNILFYSMIPAKINEPNFPAGALPTLLDNNTIEVIDTGSIWLFRDASNFEATIATVDIECTNGVIHIIDKVLLPKQAVDFFNSQRLTIMGTIVSSDDLTILEDAINITNMVEIFTPSATGPNTILAPNNQAFESFFRESSVYNSISDFDTDQEKQILRSILLYHMFPSKIYENEFVDGDLETRLTGHTIKVSLVAGNPDYAVTFSDPDGRDATIDSSRKDIECLNGVIHALERLLLPIL